MKKKRYLAIMLIICGVLSIFFSIDNIIIYVSGTKELGGEPIIATTITNSRIFAEVFLVAGLILISYGWYSLSNSNTPTTTTTTTTSNTTYYVRNQNDIDNIQKYASKTETHIQNNSVRNDGISSINESTSTNQIPGYRLKSILEYSLQYSTDDGIIGYLSTQDTSDLSMAEQKELFNIINMPKSIIREFIKSRLDDLYPPQ